MQRVLSRSLRRRGIHVDSSGLSIVLCPSNGTVARGFHGGFAYHCTVLLGEILIEHGIEEPHGLQDLFVFIVAALLSAPYQRAFLLRWHWLAHNHRRDACADGLERENAMRGISSLSLSLSPVNSILERCLTTDYRKTSFSLNQDLHY